MKPNEDEINLIWASNRNMELAECLNMEVEEESKTPSEDSLEVITTTHRTFSTKHSNHLQISPVKKVRNRKSKFLSKLRHRLRKLERQRSPYQFSFRGPNRNGLHKHISSLGKFSLNKDAPSESSLHTCLAPGRTVSQILVTEETICMGASLPDESIVRRSSYRRVSAVEIHEATESDVEQKRPDTKESKSEGSEELSRVYQRLLKPRKKSVRMQTLPEPDPTPPPSPTESEKEADFLRRSELFKQSRAYQRLTAPPRIHKSSKTDKPCPPTKESHGDSEETPLIPPAPTPQPHSRISKLAIFKREHLTDNFESAKTLALVERAASSARKRKRNSQSHLPARKTKAFERLTTPKPIHVHPVSARVGTSQTGPSPHPPLDTKPPPTECNAPAKDPTSGGAKASSLSLALSDTLEKAVKCCSSSKVFERLTALKKRNEDKSWENMRLLNEDLSDLNPESSEDEEEEEHAKLLAFRASPSYQRLTAVHKRYDRRNNVESRISQNEMKKEERTLEDKESEETIPLCEDCKKKLCESDSPVFKRLLAPRKELRGSEWSKESAVKASFAFHKFRSLLNRSLFECAMSIPPSEEEVRPPSRESSAFRRLLAPRVRARQARERMAKKSRRCTPSSSSENLLLPASDEGDSADRTHEQGDVEASRSNRSAPTPTPSEKGGRCTDTSFETISETSEVSMYSNESDVVSCFSQPEEPDDSAPLLPDAQHPSWEARAECYDIMREISALRRKMAEQISKMASEIYETPLRRGSQHDLWSKRNHKGSLWNPLKNLRSLEQRQIKHPRSKWQVLSNSPFEIK